MSEEQELVNDSTQSLPDSSTDNDLDFQAFQSALSEAGYEEQKDPVLEQLGIEHEGEMAQAETEGEEATADEPEAETQDPLASLSAIERIDHQDAVSTLTAAGFSMEQLAEMSPRTAIQVANGLRARQGQSETSQAQALESALEQAPEVQGFDFSKYADQAKDELGAKGAKLLESMMGDMAKAVATQTAEAQRKAAEQAEGMRMINDQRNRLESAIPGLADRPQLWQQITQTANALASTGLYGHDPQTLFDTAARARGLEVPQGTKPTVPGSKLLQSQPSPPKRQAREKPRGPQNMDEYTQAMLALMAGPQQMTREEAVKRLGTPPG